MLMRGSTVDNNHNLCYVFVYKWCWVTSSAFYRHAFWEAFLASSDSLAEMNRSCNWISVYIVTWDETTSIICFYHPTQLFIKVQLNWNSARKWWIFISFYFVFRLSIKIRCAAFKNLHFVSLWFQPINNMAIFSQCFQPLNKIDTLFHSYSHLTVWSHFPMISAT